MSSHTVSLYPPPLCDCEAEWSEAIESWGVPYVSRDLSIRICDGQRSGDGGGEKLLGCCQTSLAMDLCEVLSGLFCGKSLRLICGKLLGFLAACEWLGLLCM